MATRTREDSTASMKEKKGSSLSNPLGKINPKPSKIDSHPDPKVRIPTSSGKYIIPNYLKPTLSSSLEATKQQGKRPVDSHKPMLNRRRSFDSKPQSPTTQTQRSRVSLNPNLHSSSFSGKTTILDENSSIRGNKDAAFNRQHGTVCTRFSVATSRTVKKQIGETSSTKKVVTSPVDKKENPSTKMTDATEIEINDDVREHANVERGEEIGQVIGEDNEKGVLESELEQVVTEDHRTEVMEIGKGDDDDRIVINEDEASDETSQLEEIVTRQEDVKEYNTSEDSINDNDGETGVDNANENVGEKDLKGKESTKKDDAANLSEDKETEEKKMAVVKKPKAETINGAAKYQGKRESAVSNDVIEETASKLREQRKNKVKALAGAFETVISSLQEPK